MFVVIDMLIGKRNNIEICWQKYDDRDIYKSIEILCWQLYVDADMLKEI